MTPQEHDDIKKRVSELEKEVMGMKSELSHNTTVTQDSAIALGEVGQKVDKMYDVFAAAAGGFRVINL